VLPWAGFWPMLLYGALIGDIVYGEDTTIGRQLRAANASQRLYADVLHLPLPTNAQTSFNYNMMFGAEFSSHDSLPREFNNMPAHKHYNEYHFTSPLPKHWGGLHELYVKIHHEDWPHLRARRSKMGDGISYQCAKEPPTEPYFEEEYRDGTIGVFIWGTIIFCCCCWGGCITCCCWLCGCFCFAKKPQVRTPPLNPGVQMTGFAGQPQFQQQQQQQQLPMVGPAGDYSHLPPWQQPAPWQHPSLGQYPLAPHQLQQQVLVQQAPVPPQQQPGPPAAAFAAPAPTPAPAPSRPRGQLAAPTQVDPEDQEETARARQLWRQS